MKIKININELKKAVTDMDGIMKGNALPILDCLFVKAENNVITVMANNLEIAVSKHIPGDVLIDGQGLLHRDDLSMLLKMKDNAELEFTDNQCIVKGNRLFKFTVTEKVEDFPISNVVSENSPNFTIAENELLYCLKLRKIIADDSQKVAYRGIWIDKNNLLACDGNRLGKIETEFHSVKRFMIPDYALNFFAKSLEKKSCLPVSFYLSEKGYVKTISEKFEITFRQYDGDFIAYDGMFDLDNAEIAVIPKRDLTNTIGFMCDVYKSSYKGKRRPQKAVIYSFCGNKLKLAFSTDSKQVEEEIAVENLGSYIDFEIALQPLLTYELLSLIDGDKLSMSFAKPFTPSVFYGEKENEKYLLVPLSMKKAA